MIWEQIYWIENKDECPLFLKCSFWEVYHYVMSRGLFHTWSICFSLTWMYNRVLRKRTTYEEWSCFLRILIFLEWKKKNISRNCLKFNKLSFHQLFDRKFKLEEILKLRVSTRLKTTNKFWQKIWHLNLIFRPSVHDVNKTFIRL